MLIIEKFQIFLADIKNYDITKGMLNLHKFIEVIQTGGCKIRLRFMLVGCMAQCIAVLLMILAQEKF